MEESHGNTEPRPIDVLCEEERLERLAERMRRDPAESAELARERRAHIMAREVRQSGFSRSPTRGHANITSPGGISTSTNTEKRPAVAAPTRSLPVPAQRPPLSELSEASASEVLAGLKRELDKVEAALNRQEKNTTPEIPVVKAAQARAPAAAMEAEDELEGASQSLVATSTFVAVDSQPISSGVHPADRLSAALDEISVKGILELRSLQEAPAALVAVAVAAFRLVDSQNIMAAAAGMDQVHKLPEGPVKTWAEAKQILTKPGHFVNALRRFSYTADRGQVPEADLCEAEEALVDVPLHGQGLAEVHPTAARLYAWIQAALEYAAWSRSRLEGIASPARAVRTPGRPVANASPAEPATGSPVQVTRSLGESAREMPAASPSRIPHARPPTQVPVAVASAPSAAPSAARGAGFGVAWSALALEEEEGSAEGQEEYRGNPLTRARRLEGHSSQPQSSPAHSPARSPRSSPQPLSPRPNSHQVKGSPASRAPMSAMTPPAVHPSRSSSGTRRTLPAPSPQRSIARGPAGASSPRASPTRGQTAPGRGSPARPRASALVNAKGKSTASSPALLPQQPPTLLASTLPTGQLPQAEVEEYKKKLEQTKKEMRDIRSLEGKLRWGMQREEKRQVVEEKKESEQDIMQWREEQAVGMREFVKEQIHEQREKELHESKEFQVFKRDVKQVRKEEELLKIQEQLKADCEHAEMQAEIAQAVVADRHALVLEHKEDIEDLREIRENEELREKAEEEENRIHEVRLEFEHQANQLSSQKEELLRNLHLLRTTKQKMPPGTRMGQVSQHQRPRAVRAGR